MIWMSAHGSLPRETDEIERSDTWKDSFEPQISRPSSMHRPGFRGACLNAGAPSGPVGSRIRTRYQTKLVELVLSTSAQHAMQWLVGCGSVRRPRTHSVTGQVS